MWKSRLCYPIIRLQTLHTRTFRRVISTVHMHMQLVIGQSRSGLVLHAAMWANEWFRFFDVFRRRLRCGIQAHASVGDAGSPSGATSPAGVGLFLAFRAAITPVVFIRRVVVRVVNVVHVAGLHFILKICLQSDPSPSTTFRTTLISRKGSQPYF